ncbi:hypothetical protein [Novosphingobium capsulatum]|uniref:DUF7940 domain-containing protein n=1 Tax=Novosphingobium capsulatum TaxID=13688 RepID=UPI0007897F9A|nr:hypothetical protein [Novosphingobium capsulatum]WQD92779.1 hypothetical protein U0041_17620 [Novosphingobium capsulatum]
MLKIWLSKIRAEAGSLWRLWSVKMAALAGLIVTYLMSDPTLLPRLVAYVPDRWRPLASMAVGFAVFALPTIARWLPQPAASGAEK